MTRFEKAVDRAIAAENRAVEATLCRKCAGTGTLYVPMNEERTKHRREECDRCGGTGLRNGGSR